MKGVLDASLFQLNNGQPVMNDIMVDLLTLVCIFMITPTLLFRINVIKKSFMPHVEYNSRPLLQFPKHTEYEKILFIQGGTLWNTHQCISIIISVLSCFIFIKYYSTSVDSKQQPHTSVIIK